METKANNAFVKFIGTAGARFVVMKQLRASGGLWMSVEKTNLSIDPGPGALVRFLSSKLKLEKELGVKGIAAIDGLKLDLEEV